MSARGPIDNAVMRLGARHSGPWAQRSLTEGETDFQTLITGKRIDVSIRGLRSYFRLFV